MGLSIHYSGSFKESASLPKMIHEVKDIAEVCNWEYQIYEKEFSNNNDSEHSDNKNVYGISFTPPECETVSLCFLSNKRLSSSAHLKFFGKTNDKPEQEYLYMLSVKTQFAGVEIHKFIIELLRYLKKQEYFEILEVMDEGKYWETRDENLLRDIFKQNVDLLDDISFAIESAPINKGESYEAYFRRLMDMIRNKNLGKIK